MSQDVAMAWSAPAPSGVQRRDMIVTVRWALILACSYLVLFSEGSASRVLGPLVVAVYLASNLIIGRMRPETVNQQQFNVGVALFDSVFIGLCLYLAGQLEVELVVLCLGILVLAIAGFRLGVIAGATLALTAAYVVLVWLGGSESLWKSSMLLRLPFLLCAALAYSWMTETSKSHVAEKGAVVNRLVADLGAQLDAIHRCQSAVGGDKAARTALEDVATLNQAMKAKLLESQQAA